MARMMVNANSSSSSSSALSWPSNSVSNRGHGSPLKVTSETRSQTAHSQSAVVPMPSSPRPKYISAIYEYIREPVLALLHPVSSVEHYWAMRALRAETLLLAQQRHYDKLAAGVPVSHEERQAVRTS